jgi:transposase InsO family protein
LTTVPTAAGFWVPWLPFTWPQAWPFCWWVAVVIDHFSRAVVGFAISFRPPTSVEVQRSLALAIRRAGRRPQYVISDQGRQFRCKSFRRWCRRQRIRLRFGAVGEYGSLAVIERFMRSLKTECTRQILVPLRLEAMREEIALYVIWHNQHRPSQVPGRRTPREVYAGRPPANASPRIEPRANWPVEAPCASPQTTIRGALGTRLALVVGHLEGRRHLPVVALREAA